MPCNVQSSEHVTRADAVDPDVVAGPFNGERRCQVSHCGLGSVVGCLGLRNVDNGAGHTANHDNAARSLAFHQVLRDTRGEQVGTVHVDAPKLLDSVVGIADGVEVLSESGRGDQVVDLAVLLHDVAQHLGHRVGVRHIGVVCSHLGESVPASQLVYDCQIVQADSKHLRFQSRILLLELSHQLLGLVFRLILWMPLVRGQSESKRESTYCSSRQWPGQSPRQPVLDP